MSSTTKVTRATTPRGRTVTRSQTVRRTNNNNGIYTPLAMGATLGSTAVAKKSFFAQAAEYINTHRTFMVTLLLICIGMSLLIWQMTLTKHPHHNDSSSSVSSSSNGNNNDPSLDVQHHIDYPDSKVNDLAHERSARYPNMDHDACRQQCDLTDWCHFWEHNSSDNSCQLYQAITKGSNYSAAIEPHQGSHVGAFTRKLTE